MAGMSGLASLALFAAASTAAVQPQSPIGTQAQQTFANLERGWSESGASRPKFEINRWSVIGGVVSGKQPFFSWTTNMKQGQTLNFSVAGDDTITDLKSTVKNPAGEEVDSMQASGKWFGNSFTALSDGRFRFTVGNAVANRKPAFVILVFEAVNGFGVDKTALSELGAAANVLYSEALSGKDAMDVVHNTCSFFGAAIKGGQTLGISNLGFVKGPYAVFGALDKNQESTKLAVTNKEGKEVAVDPRDQPIAYCVLPNDIPSGGIRLGNESKTTQLGIAAVFKAK